MESHLLQMRGLKPISSLQGNICLGSHLLQMRGLKQGSGRKTFYADSRIFYRCVD